MPCKTETKCNCVAINECVMSGMCMCYHYYIFILTGKNFYFYPTEAILQRVLQEFISGWITN